MTLDEAMHALEAAGTEANRTTYRRHGVAGPLFGVSYATLEALRKRIKVDHELAVALWATGNHDARILATMIADPARLDAARLGVWGRELDDYVLTDALSKLAARSDAGRELAETWRRSDDEWLGTAGWNLAAQQALTDPDAPDSAFEPLLDAIGRTIHDRPNRVRYAMNGALIAIGMRNASLERRASEVAARVGTVHVDHGQTGCKTPDAASYIARARSRTQAKAAKPAAPKRPRKSAS